MAAKIQKLTKKQFPDGIEAYGTDALRFTLCSLASTGRDVQFNLERTAGYRNFCNKLWNAARYVIMNTEESDNGLDNQSLTLGVADQWILGKLNECISDTRKSLDNYRFDHAAQAIYDFVWNEYCDWYLELSKPTLIQSPNSEAAIATRNTLLRVLDSVLKNCSSYYFYYSLPGIFYYGSNKYSLYENSWTLSSLDVRSSNK